MFGILCFGDSITHGRGEMPSFGWVGRLKNYFEEQDFYKSVYNLGIPGNNSVHLVKRFDAECQARIKVHHQGDKFVILVAIGSNDCKWEGSPEDDNPRVRKDIFKKNIKELIKKAKKYEAEFVFIGLIPVDEKRTLPYEETSFKNERVKLFNDIVKDACAQEEVLFLDMFEEFGKKDYAGLLVDGVHPNSKGYDKMYEIVKEFLIRNKLFEGVLVGSR